MFGLFKSKQTEVKVIDKVYTSLTAKTEACRNLVNNENAVLIAWFAETKENLEVLFGSDNVFMAREIGAQHIDNQIIYFVEHYPLHLREEQLFEKLGLKEVVVLTSLDEPFFQAFGGENIRMLMEKLGMEPGECIEHTMVSKAIRNAQDKISKQVLVDTESHSQEQWMKRLVKMNES